MRVILCEANTGGRSSDLGITEIIMTAGQDFKGGSKEEIETTNQKIFEIKVCTGYGYPPYGERRKIWILYVEMFLYSGMDTLDWKSKNVIRL